MEVTERMELENGNFGIFRLQNFLSWLLIDLILKNDLDIFPLDVTDRIGLDFKDWMLLNGY